MLNFNAAKIGAILAGIGLLMVLGNNQWGWIVILLVALVAVTINMFRDSSKMKCPKCDSENLNVVKSKSKGLRASMFFLIGVFGLLAHESKDLFVCRNCGFSWEDR